MNSPRVLVAGTALAQVLRLDEPLSFEPIGIALSPSDPQFRTLLDNYIVAFEGTGILQQLRKKWLEDGSWIAALP